VDPSEVPVLPGPGVVPGEILPEGLEPAEFEKIEEARRKVAEGGLGRVAWRKRPLGAVAEDLAAASGIEVVLDGEGLADEPITFEASDVKVRQVLDHVSVSRALRFEVRPGKVVIRR
jgi:hypothetical protein